MNKLAIGITTYNNVDNIDNIEKLYNLEFVDTYIVDDSSTDGTQEELAKRGIKYEVPPRKIGAPGYSRNMILEKAINSSAKFISFVDGDDYVLEYNLHAILDSLETKYDMILTPMMTVGYNDALIPLGASNYTFTGELTKSELLSEENARLKKQLLMGSGGRIYNLDVIKQNNLKYDKDKSGQDTLFNHTIFSKSNLIKYNDVKKPFYVYDIQMGSLSNNYKVSVLTRRLILIAEVAKFDFAIHTREEYADKAFKRYSNSFLMTENDKLELGAQLSEYTGKAYNYIKSNDYLLKTDISEEYENGINVVMINHNISLDENDQLNIINISSVDELKTINQKLKFNKTIFIDRTIQAIDQEFLLSTIDSSHKIIQPVYRDIRGQDIHGFHTNKYHGYSLDSFANTYTYIGMIYDTNLLSAYDFSYTSFYEYLIKVMFFNHVIPVIHNTQNCYKSDDLLTIEYQKEVRKLVDKCYFANTGAKFFPYSKLVKMEIQEGSFIGKNPTYKSENLSFENQSFVETQLEEFEQFEGAFIVDQNDNIIETTSKQDEIDFSNMILGKRSTNAKSQLADKKLINIPAEYSIPNCKQIKLYNYTVTFSTLTENSLSTSSLRFDNTVTVIGYNKNCLSFVNEEGDLIEDENLVLPAGTYKVRLTKDSLKVINELDGVRFNKHIKKKEK